MVSKTGRRATTCKRYDTFGKDHYPFSHDALTNSGLVQAGGDAENLSFLQPDADTTSVYATFWLAKPAGLTRVREPRAAVLDRRPWPPFCAGRR